MEREAFYSEHPTNECMDEASATLRPCTAFHATAGSTSRGSISAGFSSGDTSTPWTPSPFPSSFGPRRVWQGRGPWPAARTACRVRRRPTATPPAMAAGVAGCCSGRASPTTPPPPCIAGRDVCKLPPARGLPGRRGRFPQGPGALRARNDQRTAGEHGVCHRRVFNAAGGGGGGRSCSWRGD